MSKYRDPIDDLIVAGIIIAVGYGVYKTVDALFGKEEEHNSEALASVAEEHSSDTRENKES